MQTLAAGLPGRIEIHALDVADSAALARAAQEACARHGAPDLVIANAGISVGTHGDDAADVAKLRRLLEVNVTGLAATLAAFAPSMRAARRGTLCGIASVAAFRGLPGAGAYYVVGKTRFGLLFSGSCDYSSACILDNRFHDNSFVCPLNRFCDNAPVGMLPSEPSDPSSDRQIIGFDFLKSDLTIRQTDLFGFG
jgi:hypothetical protein